MKRALVLGAFLVAILAGSYVALRPAAPEPEEESAASVPDAAARLAAAGSASQPKETAAVAVSRFLGRVVDPAGRPIAAATVTAREIVSPSWIRVRRGLFATAASASDGTFELRLPVARALADVAATAPGFASAGVERVAPDRPVELRMAREGVLRGRVFDERGKPIPGASVRAFRVLGRDHLDTVSAVTGADGEFRLGGFGKTGGEHAVLGSRLLVVRAAGFGGFERWSPFPEDGEDLRQDVLLLPARPLEVLVLDADTGAPVSGALVNVGWASGGLQTSTSSESRPPIPHPAPYLDEGTADDRGVCTLGGVPTQIAPDQRLVVRAWKRGHTRESTMVPVRTDGPGSPVEVQIWPAAIVRGRVVDADGGPVARTYVRGSYLGSWPVPVDGVIPGALMLTDEDGRYVFPEMRATALGIARQWVSTSGGGDLRPDGREVSVPQEIQVEIRPRTGEETTAPDLVVGKPRITSSARVLVVDAEGRPVPDAQVAGGLERVRTDESGKALLRWSTAAPPEWARPTPAEAAGERGVSVIAAGFARTRARCRPSVDAPPEVRIVLARGRRLEGRVREADGRPIAGAQVRLSREDPTGFLHLETISGHDGTFSADDLPAAPFRVSAFLRNERGSPEVEAIPGGAPVEVTFVADPYRRATLVATLVAEEDGSPLVDGLVAVASEPTPGGEQTPRDSPGVEVVRNVPVGTWTVTGSATGRLAVSHSVAFAEGETAHVRLALPRGTRAAFRLDLPAEARAAVRGSPQSADPVYVLRVDAEPAEPGAVPWAFQRLDDDLVLRFDALHAGRYRLSIHNGRARTYPSASAPEAARPYVSTTWVEVGPPHGKPAEATVEFVLGGMLGVRIDDPEAPQSTGRPFQAYYGTIEVVAAGGERHALVPWKYRGYAGEFPLLPGQYIVRVHMPSGRTLEKDVTVEAGKAVVVGLGGK